MLCGIAERFGQPPHEVGDWPASTLQMLQMDSMMRKAFESKDDDRDGQ